MRQFVLVVVLDSPQRQHLVIIYGVSAWVNEWILWNCSDRGWSQKPSRRRQASGLLGRLVATRARTSVACPCRALPALQFCPQFPAWLWTLSISFPCSSEGQWEKANVTKCAPKVPGSLNSPIAVDPQPWARHGLSQEAPCGPAGAVLSKAQI